MIAALGGAQVPAAPPRSKPARSKRAPESASGGWHLAVRSPATANVVNSLVTRPFKILELQIRILAGFVKFLRAQPQIPFRLEIRQGALDLAEIHAIAARIRPAIR